jgi:hypothetical protein
MKLLVDKTLLSYATPVVYSGFSASQHNTNIMSTFDTFDSYEPTVYFADADLLNSTVYKAIDERPALRVCIIQKTEGEHGKRKEFQERFGNTYLWTNDIACGDIYMYRNPLYVKEYAADLVAIENDHREFLESLIVPSDMIFRIFSNQLIHGKRYCGIVPEQANKDIYRSSKFSIATENNIYNSALCDCYPIEPKQFSLDLLYQDKKQEVKQMKELTIEVNTNFHVVSSVLAKLGFDKESKIILEKMKELL